MLFYVSYVSQFLGSKRHFFVVQNSRVFTILGLINAILSYSCVFGTLQIKEALNVCKKLLYL
jgi:hypothetical protein